MQSDLLLVAQTKRILRSILHAETPYLQCLEGRKALEGMVR